MGEYRIKVAPDSVAYADADNGRLMVEFAIPATPARDIEYIASLALGWPV
jgi:hypothetical protein